jgi:hypothetical protein
VPISDDELRNRFTYHAPTEEQAKTYETMRSLALQLARNIIHYTPDSREQSLALVHLDEVVYWANAAIARRTE